MLRKVCDACGSENVDIEAVVGWNYEEQKFEVESYSAECWCFDCNDKRQLEEFKETFQWQIIDKANIVYDTDKYYSSIEEVRRDYDQEDVLVYKRLDSTRKIEEA